LPDTVPGAGQRLSRRPGRPGRRPGRRRGAGPVDRGRDAGPGLRPDRPAAGAWAGAAGAAGVRLPERVGDQVRIGVAVQVPPPFGPDLQSARAGFGDPLAQDIPPHVTLLGPTVVDPTELEAVRDHLT